MPKADSSDRPHSFIETKHLSWEHGRCRWPDPHLGSLETGPRSLAVLPHWSIWWKSQDILGFHWEGQNREETGQNPEGARQEAFGDLTTLARFRKQDLFLSPATLRKDLPTHTQKNLFLVTLESLQKFYYLRFCQLGQIFNFSFLKNRTDLEVVISCRSGPETPVWRCFIALVFQFSKLSEKNIFMKKVFWILHLFSHVLVACYWWTSNTWMLLEKFRNHWLFSNFLSKHLCLCLFAY